LVPDIARPEIRRVLLSLFSKLSVEKLARLNAPELRQA